MKRYAIGAGAQGRVIADILHSRGLTLDGFLDDDIALLGTRVNGYPVIGSSRLLFDAPDMAASEAIVAVGNPEVRLHLTAALLGADHIVINAVHAQAVISPMSRLGRGICVCAGAVVNPDATIGDAVIINTGATVDHDCEIGDGAHLSPGVHLAGRVSVGRLTFLGTGVSVVPRARIGAGVIIGAGAVVVSDIPDGVLAVGVPARIIRNLAAPIDWSRLL